MEDIEEVWEIMEWWWRNLCRSLKVELANSNSVILQNFERNAELRTHSNFPTKQLHIHGKKDPNYYLNLANL